MKVVSKERFYAIGLGVGGRNLEGSLTEARPIFPLLFACHPTIVGYSGPTTVRKGYGFRDKTPE